MKSVTESNIIERKNRLENLISQKIGEAFDLGKDYVHMVNRKDIDIDVAAARIKKQLKDLKAELIEEAED